jgi:hypothetical protein
MESNKDIKMITCKVKSMLNGSEFIIEAQEDSTFEELKIQIISYTDCYESVNDFNIILNGRVIRNTNEKLNIYIKSDSATFFLNSSNVHGGCIPKKFY